MENLKQELATRLEETLANRRCEAVGMVLGGVFAVSVLLFGFFSTAFVIICAVVGWKIGQLSKSEEGLSGFIDNKLWRHLSRWR